MYNTDLKWMWTTSTVYPWVYLNEIQDWRYYLPQLGFYNAETKTGHSLSELVFNDYNSAVASYTFSITQVAFLVSNNKSRHGSIAP